MELITAVRISLVLALIQSTSGYIRHIGEIRRPSDEPDSTDTLNDEAQGLEFSGSLGDMKNIMFHHNTSHELVELKALHNLRSNVVDTRIHNLETTMVQELNNVKMDLNQSKNETRALKLDLLDETRDLNDVKMTLAETTQEMTVMKAAAAERSALVDQKILKLRTQELGLARMESDLINAKNETQSLKNQMNNEIKSLKDIFAKIRIGRTAPAAPALAKVGCEINLGTTLLARYTCNIPHGKLIRQTDGNLVIYDTNGRLKWSTRTEGRASRIVFQDDGNLVVYDAANMAIWASYTNGSGKRLIFQDDRNFVILDNEGKAIWKSGTDV